MYVILACLVVAGAAVALAGVWMLVQRRRTAGLQEQFGPEYGRTVAQLGGHREGEAELESRRERVAALHIVALSPDDAETFASRWQEVQGRFVDAPSDAIGEADALVAELMQKRGYPVGDIEERMADISVDHPQVMTDYRAAHVISLANARGETDTEQLREAMLHYRSLFDDLLETRVITQREDVA